MTHATNGAAVLAYCWAKLQQDPAYVFSWTELGHGELEGSPILNTPNGPVQVPAHPPAPGTRLCDGAAY